MLRTAATCLFLAIPIWAPAAEAGAPLPGEHTGLVGWYRFVSAATLGKDDSGQHHDASVVDGATWTDRDAGRRSCAVFDGKARLSLPAVARGDFTVALWVKSTAPAQPGAWYNAPPLLDGDVPGDAKDFGAVLLDGRFALGQGQPDAVTSSESRIADGAWRHVAATRDATSGEVRIYVDARLERTATGPTGERSAVTALTIGARPGAGDGFAGRLDDLRIYDRVLSAPELARLAHGPGAVRPLLVRDTRSDTWAGMDALGRSLPEPGSVPARSGKAVGIFYFLWIGRHGPDHVYDLS
ncbi:MAG: LamG domain-containing protein, partial [Planctomycetes bacterium]|nr:LamG domain-containing protein [Planctomycetota bacterium]